MPSFASLSPEALSKEVLTQCLSIGFGRICYAAGVRAPPNAAIRALSEGALWIVLALGLQVAMLLDPGFLERDPEELFSAGQAWLALNGDLSWLLHMQYRPFCGGCTVHAVTAMGLFSALPPTWLTWKVIPLLWSLTGLGIGIAMLRREGLVAGSRMFALLWVFSPLAFANLSLVAWGNHYEAGVLGLGAAWWTLGARTPRRRFGLGVWLGFSVYVSFSAGFIVLACLGFVLSRERMRGVLPVLLGIPVGLLGWVLQWWVAGQHPFHTIYEEGVRAGIAAPPGRVVDASRAAPARIAVCGPGGWLGPGLGIALRSRCAWLLALWMGSRPVTRLAALLLGAFLLVYGLTGFSVKVADTGFRYAGGLRYAAPLFPAAALLLAGVAGGLWTAGRRLPAVALLVPWLVAGIWGRSTVLLSMQPAPERLGRDAVDWDYLRERLAWMIPAEGHEAGLQSADPHTRAVHAYGLARERVTAGMRGAPVVLPAGCAAGMGAEMRLRCLPWTGHRWRACRFSRRWKRADWMSIARTIAVDAIARGEVEDWVSGTADDARGSPCGGSDVGAAQSRPAVGASGRRLGAFVGSAWDLLLAGGGGRRIHDQFPCDSSRRSRRASAVWNGTGRSGVAPRG